MSFLCKKKKKCWNSATFVLQKRFWLFIKVTVCILLWVLWKGDQNSVPQFSSSGASKWRQLCHSFHDTPECKNAPCLPYCFPFSVSTEFVLNNGADSLHQFLLLLLLWFLIWWFCKLAHTKFWNLEMFQELIVCLPNIKIGVCVCVSVCLMVMITQSHYQHILRSKVSSAWAGSFLVQISPPAMNSWGGFLQAPLSFLQVPDLQYRSNTGLSFYGMP